jgi:hypothetical protein
VKRNTYKCIYCGTSTPQAVFNREHVIPDAFGRFRGALVLHDTVCKPCNDYFSGTLDLVLARESMEGLERYRWGIKPSAKVDQFRYRHMTLRAHDAGDFSGAELRLGPGNSDHPFTAHIVPSAAMRRRESEGFEAIPESEILDGTWSQREVDWRRGVRLFGDEAGVARMREALENAGVHIESYKPIIFAEPDDGQVAVEHEFRIPQEVQRAIAKIAFNYLAYRTGSAYVLAPAFDPIRRFIRFDEAPHLPPLNTSDELPYRTGLPDDQRPVLHWLSIDAHESHRNLLGTVSLFSVMQHNVILAEDYAGPWFDLPVAHVYNVKRLEVTEVQPVTPRWRHTDRPAGSI